MTDRTFFVYVHKRPDTGEVFYVGKGTWTPKKAYGRSRSGDNRNPMWLRIVAKNGGAFDAEIVAEFDSESDAFDLERDLIKRHGRKHLGVGTLANMTDGGEGAVGRIVRAETIEKLRRAMAGRPPRHPLGPMLGRQHSPESRAAISAASSGSSNPMFGKRHGEGYRQKVAGVINAGSAKKARRVIDTSTGTEYPSIRSAAAALGYNGTTLKHWLRGLHENKSSLRYA